MLLSKVHRPGPRDGLCVNKPRLYGTPSITFYADLVGTTLVDLKPDCLNNASVSSSGNSPYLALYERDCGKELGSDPIFLEMILWVDTKSAEWNLIFADI